MNHYYGNSSFYHYNYYSGNISEGTFNDNGAQENKQYLPKPKAYINPRIINYEYIKKSIDHGCVPQPKKIHFNPNFKSAGKSVSYQGSNEQVALITSSTIVPKLESSPKYIDNTVPAKEEKFSQKPVLKLTSQYKVVNKTYAPENQSLDQSKYSWSRQNNETKNERLCGIVNSRNLISNIESNKTTESRTKNLISGNKFKFVAAKITSKTINSKNNEITKKASPIYLSKTKVITFNGKKLINKTMAKSMVNAKSPKKPSMSKVLQNQDEIVYNKSQMTLKAANIVKNKYRYNRTTNLIRKSKFKIDKRKKLSENSKKLSMVKNNDIRNLFPASSYNKVKYFYVSSKLKPVNRLLKLQHFHSWSQRKAFCGKHLKKTNSDPNKRIVKIGGILYKSTSNKLTLANVTNKEKHINSDTKLIVGGKKTKKTHIVYVRGEKFLLDKNGKTLIRQKEDSSNKRLVKFKRIDIGGVTYMEKSQNLLIRTNVHNARHIVSQAKNKSIATLCHLRKKSALPCMIYHKFGKCIRHKKGLCMYKHDPKNIAVCKRFLKGECKDNKCMLSHEVIKEKMATCSFFLNGCCIRENCPFLHVKLNENVGICEDFLHGFCNLGQNCCKRHLFQCPEYDKHGKCSSGTKCLYPHKAKKSTEVEVEKSKDTGQIQYTVKEFQSITKSKSKKGKREMLKLKNKDLKMNKTEKKDKKGKRKSVSLSTDSNQSPDVIECVPKRIKLQDLPSFIPLDIS